MSYSMFFSNDPGYNPNSPKWSLSRTSCESNSNLDMHYAQISWFDLETLELYGDNTTTASSLESTWPWNVLGSSSPIAPRRGPLTSDILPQSNLSTAVSRHGLFLDRSDTSSLVHGAITLQRTSSGRFIDQHEWTEDRPAVRRYTQ